MRHCRPIVLLACLVLAGMSFAPLPGTSRAAVQQAPDTVDLATIVLTTPDLENAGFAGYGIVNAGFRTREDDVDALAQQQRLDSVDMSEIFADTGSAGSYNQVQQIPLDSDEPGGSPRLAVNTRAYLFEDAAGAEAALAVITDESQMANVVDIEDAGTGIGDESELSVIQHETNATELELEIRYDRLVLAVSTLDVENQITAPAIDPDDLARLTALGERLVERADTALNGETSKLTPMVLRLESDVTIIPYTAYTMLDGDPIRRVEETEENYSNRVDRWRQQGFTDHVRSEQPLRDEGNSAGQLLFSPQVFQFEDEQAATSYMAGREEFFDANPNTEAAVIDAPELGDQSVMISETGDANGVSQERKILVVRVGDIVTSTLIELVDAPMMTPEISVELLIEIGEAHVDCMEAGACDGALPMPDELSAIL